MLNLFSCVTYAVTAYIQAWGNMWPAINLLVHIATSFEVFWHLAALDTCLELLVLYRNLMIPMWCLLPLTSMDANPNMYPILIPPASNTFYFAITHSLITTNSSMLNPSSIIHHSSSMATPNIKLTQLPLSQFSQYSIDSPPHFTHLLIQSSDPVLKMTHVIGDC